MNKPDKIFYVNTPKSFAVQVITKKNNENFILKPNGQVSKYRLGSNVLEFTNLKKKSIFSKIKHPTFIYFNGTKVVSRKVTHNDLKIKETFERNFKHPKKLNERNLIYPKIPSFNSLKTIDYKKININSNYCKLNANKISGDVRKTSCRNVPEFGDYGCTTNKRVCKPLNLLRLYNLFDWTQVILYEDNAKFLPSKNNNAINEGYSEFIKLRNLNYFNTYSNPGNVFDGASIKGNKFQFDNSQKLLNKYNNPIKYNEVYDIYYQRRVNITIDNKEINFDFFVLDNEHGIDDYMVLVKIVDDGNNDKRKVTQVLISTPGKNDKNIKGNVYIKEEKMILHKGLSSPGEEFYKKIIDTSESKYSETSNEWKFWKVLGDASQVAFCDLLGKSDETNLHILFTIENENKLPALAKLHNVNVLQRNNKGIYRLYLNNNSKKFLKKINNLNNNSNTSSTISTATNINRQRTKRQRNNRNNNEQPAKMEKFNKSLLNLHNERIKKMKLLIELKKKKGNNPFNQQMIKLLENNVNKLNKIIEKYNV